MNENSSAKPEIFFDPNPIVLRRSFTGNPLIYSQNVKIRFLKPTLPVSSVPLLIIREVRPPQPEAPAPLRIRQIEKTPEKPAPLILRERPPPLPKRILTEQISRVLPAQPVPPRSVIIERIPAAPEKPPEILIERWIPYPKTTGKRQTIIERAEPVRPYPEPRNSIILHEPVPVKVERKIQCFGPIVEDPKSYAEKYGETLLDGEKLVEEARGAGLVGFFPSRENVPTIDEVLESNFRQADLNQDGTIDREEFRIFLKSKLQ